MAKKFSVAVADLYSKFYSPEKLFIKITDVAKAAGVKVLYAVLILYYAVMDKEVPLKDKIAVFGALGYFICPTDFIPDFLPGGYADDFTALITVVKTIWGNISPQTQEKARQRLSDWFQSVNPEDIKLF